MEACWRLTLILESPTSTSPYPLPHALMPRLPHLCALSIHVESIGTKASYFTSVIPHLWNAFHWSFLPVLKHSLYTSCCHFLPGFGKCPTSSYAQASQPTAHKNTSCLWKLPATQSNQLQHLGLSAFLPCADSDQRILCLHIPCVIPHTLKFSGLSLHTFLCLLFVNLIQTRVH